MKDFSGIRYVVLVHELFGQKHQCLNVEQKQCAPPITLAPFLYWCFVDRIGIMAVMYSQCHFISSFRARIRGVRRVMEFWHRGTRFLIVHRIRHRFLLSALRNCRRVRRPRLVTGAVLDL